MNTIFKSKEQYLAMRTQWAHAVNSPKAKSTIVPCNEWIEKTQTVSEGTGAYRKPGWVTAKHHIIYNLLRQRPADKGFTKSTNPQKLDSRPDPVKYTIIELRKLQSFLLIHNNGWYDRWEKLRKLQRFLFIPNNSYSSHLDKLLKEGVEMENGSPKHGWSMYHQMCKVRHILAPFGDSVTVEHLLRLTLPKGDEQGMM